MQKKDETIKFRLKDDNAVGYIVIIFLFIILYIFFIQITVNQRTIEEVRKMIYLDVVFFFAFSCIVLMFLRSIYDYIDIDGENMTLHHLLYKDVTINCHDLDLCRRETGLSAGPQRQTNEILYFYYRSMPGLFAAIFDGLHISKYIVKVFPGFAQRKYSPLQFAMVTSANYDMMLVYLKKNNIKIEVKAPFA